MSCYPILFSKTLCPLWQNRISIQKADLVTANSLELLERARTLGAKNRELIRFCADLNIFKPERQGDEQRACLGLRLHDRVIFSPRAFDQLYNIDIIAASMPDVLVRFPNARFLFNTYQCTTTRRIEYRAEIEQKMIDQGVGEFARFAGDLTTAQLQQLYRLSEIIVSIPDADGFPVTIFEALACERPVIVGDLHAYDGIIIDGQTGLRVDPRNACSLSAAISSLLASTEMGRDMASAGRRLALQHGDFAREMARMEALYVSLIG